MESIPFADSDESYFIAREYTAIDAILGERAEPFYGIPTGPIQVGHFVGALGILLMAYVEYPGFPLTNLPTPLREAFQGGLSTVYSINVVLAVISIFKAQARGQPILLWFFKNLSVGGLAFDQLNQLPTLEEVAEREKLDAKQKSEQRKPR